jgi:hypothetical protein
MTRSRHKLADRASRLMGEDEAGTHRALGELRRAVDPLIGSHGGRIVNAVSRELKLFNRQYEPIWQRMPGSAAEPADSGERIARWGNLWFYDECCGTPRRPPPRKSQATIALLQAALAHFIAGKDVSQWLLPKGPIPRLPVRRRYQFGKAETDI